MDWTDDGMDDQTDSGEASFLIPTSFTIYDDKCFFGMGVGQGEFFVIS